MIVIPDNKEVSRLKRDNSYVPRMDGWFVPDSRMVEILNKISQDKISREYGK